MPYISFKLNRLMVKKISKFTTADLPACPPIYCGIIFPFEAILHVTKSIRQFWDFSGDLTLYLAGGADVLAHGLLWSKITFFLLWSCNFQYLPNFYFESFYKKVFQKIKPLTLGKRKIWKTKKLFLNNYMIKSNADVIILITWLMLNFC